MPSRSPLCTDHDWTNDNLSFPIHWESVGQVDRKAQLSTAVNRDGRDPKMPLYLRLLRREIQCHLKLVSCFIWQKPNSLCNSIIRADETGKFFLEKSYRKLM